MYNMIDLFGKHSRIILTILVWVLVLINVVGKNKNFESKYNKMQNIKNNVGFAVTFTLFALLSKVISGFITTINISKNNSTDMFLLNWFIHILLMILVLEIIKFLFDIVNRSLLIFFIPVTLIITGVMKKFVVSLIINNTAVFLFTLSILLQTIVGMGLFMAYNLCIYERIVYKDETN
ncbi:MAG: hypothetical protein Q4Q31_11300 [Bacillota bacterium]|nr:hypothetical protein [Bacillota bacterium]